MALHGGGPRVPITLLTSAATATTVTTATAATLTTPTPTMVRIRRLARFNVEKLREEEAEVMARHAAYTKPVVGECNLGRPFVRAPFSASQHSPGVPCQNFPGRCGAPLSIGRFLKTVCKDDDLPHPLVVFKVHWEAHPPPEAARLRAERVRWAGGAPP